jgi:hypothetical protein
MTIRSRHASLLASQLSPKNTIPTVETTNDPSADQIAYATPTSIFASDMLNPMTLLGKQKISSLKEMNSEYIVPIHVRH